MQPPRMAVTPPSLLPLWRSISVNRLVYEELDTAQLPVLNVLDRPVVLTPR